MDFNQQHWMNQPASNNSKPPSHHQRLFKQTSNKSQPVHMKTPTKFDMSTGPTCQHDCTFSIFSSKYVEPVSVRARMRNFSNRNKWAAMQQQVEVSGNSWSRSSRKYISRCATEQRSTDFAEKFYWKSIPENLQIKRKYTLETDKKQIAPKNNLLCPEKNINMTSTKVSTNGFQSLQISKQTQQPQQQIKNNTEPPTTQPQIHSFQLYQFFESLKSARLRQHDIEEVESITRSRITDNSGNREDIEGKEMLLDESFVEWTYQTGFKTSLDNLITEEEA